LYNSDFNIIEMEIDKISHIHLMIQYILRVLIFTIVNYIKSIILSEFGIYINVVYKITFEERKLFGRVDIMCLIIVKIILKNIRNYIINQG